MNASHFDEQMKRLYSTFGEKSFSNERIRLIWNHVSDLPDNNFTRIVNHLLSTQRYAPLPKEFKEAAVAERKAMEGDKHSVPAIMTSNFKGDGSLQKVLAGKYDGCKNLFEAIELEKFRLKIKSSENEYNAMNGTFRPPLRSCNDS